MLYAWKGTLVSLLVAVPLAVAGLAAAQDVELPPVGIPGYNVVGEAHFLDTIVPNEPLPPMVVPLLPFTTPPVSAGLGSVRVCGADDSVAIPLPPIKPPPGLPVSVEGLDLVPCSVGGAVDARTPCDPADPLLAGPVGQPVAAGAASVDGQLATNPLTRNTFLRNAPAQNLLFSCRGATPGVVGLIGNDPSETTVSVVDELPVCPYPSLSAAPCFTVPVDTVVNQAIADAGALPLNRGGCSFSQVFVDCGTVITPGVVTPPLSPVSEEPVTIAPMAVDTGQAVRDGIAATPNGGVVDVGPLNTDQETPGSDPITVVPATDAGSLGQCITPGLPGPGEGRLPGIPSAHLWIFPTSQKGGSILGSVDNIVHAPPAYLVDPLVLGETPTPVGSVPGQSVPGVATPAELRALLLSLPRIEPMVFGSDIFALPMAMAEQAFTERNREVVDTVHAVWPFAGPGGQPDEGTCTGPSETATSALLAGLPQL